MKTIPTLPAFAAFASLATLALAMAAPQRGGGNRSSNTAVDTVTQLATVGVTTAALPADTGGVVTTSPLATGGGAESHSVQIINNCGSGRGVFLYRDSPTPQGSTTIQGPLYGGVAWVDGFADANCLSSGVNCGTVEFSLINQGTDGANTHNSINYSLQSQGNHQWTYPMHFRYTGGCGGAPGACTSAANCPGAFVGFDTASGTPVDCQGTNEGIVITFC